MTNSRFIPALAFLLMLVSCLQTQEFVQDVFVYEPHGSQVSIAQLRQLTPMP